MITAVAVALVVAGCSAGKQSPEQRFSKGICAFLARQPERQIVPPGSVLVAASDGRHCKDPSSNPRSPYWGVGAQYRWMRSFDARGPLFTFYKAALAERGWRDIRISVLNPDWLNPNERVFRLHASTRREGKLIGIAITLDRSDGGLFDVGIGTDWERQGHSVPGNGAPRATLTR